jgi:hypothetical protein
LLHDKQCTDGNVAFEPKLHLQQTIPLLCFEPYKHLKTIKLNPWAREDVFLVHPQCALVVVGSLQRSSSSIRCKSCALVGLVVFPHHNTELAFHHHLQSIPLLLKTSLLFVLHSTINN